MKPTKLSHNRQISFSSSFSVPFHRNSSYHPNHMTLVAIDNIFVEFTQLKAAGTPWVVRVYKKSFFMKKLISSDWFLDEQQATIFAEKIADEIRRGGSALSLMQKRKPGWTLRRPS
ncbi:MAG: hypothetical protein ACKVRP_07835 [Bacteroidota bacterium]